MMAEHDDAVFAALDDLRKAYSEPDLSKALALIRAYSPKRTEAEEKALAMVAAYNKLRKQVLDTPDLTEVLGILQRIRGIDGEAFESAEQTFARLAKYILSGSDG